MIKILGIAGDFKVGKSYIVSLFRKEISNVSDTLSVNLYDLISLKFLYFALKEMYKNEEIYVIYEFDRKLKYPPHFLRLYGEKHNIPDYSNFKDIIQQILFVLGIHNYTEKHINELLKLELTYKSFVLTFEKDPLYKLTKDFVDFLRNEGQQEKAREHLLEYDLKKIFTEIAPKSGIRYIFFYIYAKAEFEWFKQNKYKIVYIKNENGSHAAIFDPIKDEEKLKYIQDPNYRRKQKYFEQNSDFLIYNTFENDLKLLQKLITIVEEV